MKKISWQKNLLLLWLSQLAVMSGFSAMVPFVPLFIKEKYGIADTGELAFYVASFNFFGTLAYAVFCPIWGVLADKFGVKPMLLRGTFVTSWMFALMAYVPTAGWLIFLRFLTAACAGTTAASHVMIARNTPDDRQGFAQGVLTTAVWGGAMLGNVIGGFIIHYFNYTCAFWLCCILYVFAGFAVLFTVDDFSGQVVPIDPIIRTDDLITVSCTNREMLAFAAKIGEKVPFLQMFNTGAYSIGDEIVVLEDFMASRFKIVEEMDDLDEALFKEYYKTMKLVFGKEFEDDAKEYYKKYLEENKDKDEKSEPGQKGE